jgi:Flp pilus assembly protein TadB
MTETASLDRQLADMVWMMSTALRAGYPIHQVFTQLASEAPEPAASSCALVTADLNSGLSLERALAHWQEAVPSSCLAEVIAVIREHQQTKGDLPDMLAPVSNKIMANAGTDQALWPAMRTLAQSVGAVLPQYVQEQ